MKYVIYTAKYNSFSKAAKELFVTQPNISNAIKELEQELKIQIFERGKSGVSLTKEGVVFLNQISPVVEQMGLIEDFYAKENEADNMLSVASQHCTLFSETMAQLLLDHTFGDSYKIHILEAKTKEVLEYVQSGMCEIGILLKNRDNPGSWNREIWNFDFCRSVIRMYICAGSILWQIKKSLLRRIWHHIHISSIIRVKIVCSSFQRKWWRIMSQTRLSM